MSLIKLLSEIVSRRLIDVSTLSLAFFLSTSQLHADVIASFEFDGNDYTAEPNNTTGFNTNLNLASSVSVTGLSLGVLQFSPNLDPTAALGFAADDFDNALGFSTDANDDRNLLTSNQVVYFDIDVDSGYKLGLQSLSFESLKTRGNNATGSRVTYSIFANPAGDPSVDGLIGDLDFVTSLAHDHFADGESGAESTGGSFTTGRWNTGPVDLSQPRLQELTGSNRIAIRMYASDGADRDFGIDNLVLNGQVTAIPEPAGTCLLLLGIAATACRRRR